jgi:two-component system OmpR family response regulator
VRILVVEDSGPTRELLVRALEADGADIVTASRFATGLRQASSAGFDVIILDLMLPDGDGLDLCRRIRSEGVTTPVLCLTARGEVADRVHGLDSGADDYLRKPFALAELKARIRALGRRQGQAAPSRLASGSLRIDFTARRMTRSDQEVPLTAREWAVLEVLAARLGRVVPRHDLLEDIWHDTGRASSESLDVILSRLRRKLRSLDDGFVVRTVRGTGFVLETPA